MIREFLTETLPGRLRAPEEPVLRQRGGTRITLLCAVVVLLSGWFESPYALVLILLASSVVLAFVRFCAGLRTEGWMMRVVLVALLAGVAVAITATALIPMWNDWLVVGVIAGAFGYNILTWFDPVPPGYPRSEHGETLKKIGEPIRASAGDAATPMVMFRPSFPATAADEATIWAIDPARRALRVMAPINATVDEVVEWDEPIRSVALTRAKLSRWWPSMKSRLRAARRDRDLEIISGADENAKWRYVFQFHGPDMAERWRDVFESWMIKDRERVQA